MEKNMEWIQVAEKALDDKFGKDIVVLDIRKISVLTDFFVIATGNNPSQLKAMAEEAEEKLYRAGLRLAHSEGQADSGWMLLDFGDMIVHLFNKESRSFYNLERIWSDADIIDVQLTD